MNALIGVRANASGALSANPTQRREAAKEVLSLWRAGATKQLMQAAQKEMASSQNTKSVSAAKASETARAVDNSLDRNAFLELLVYQMQNQDPLEPIDNSDMIAQLAQFSSLEQMNNLNESFATLSGNIDQLNFISASTLVGQTVNGFDVNGNAVSGVVERVHLDGSIVYLTVNDTLMSMAGVLGIGE